MNKTFAFWPAAAAALLLAACSAADNAVPSGKQAVFQTALPKRPLPFGEYADPQGCTVNDAVSGRTDGVVNRLAFEHYNGVSYMKKDDVLRHFGEAKARGCSLERKDEAGFAPLHTAILLHDVKLMAFLLENGADPYTEIAGDPEKQGGRQFYGKDSYQLVAALKSFELQDNGMKTIKSRNNRILRVPKSKGVRSDYSKIDALLEQYRRR